MGPRTDGRAKTGARSPTAGRLDACSTDVSVAMLSALADLYQPYMYGKSYTNGKYLF